VDNDITLLGRIINVNAYDVEVEVDEKLPSAAPIISGRQYRIGQIGSLVKVKMGNVLLYGVVASVSNVGTSQEENVLNLNSDSLQKRYLKVNLIGEKIGKREFQTGIGMFPTINDEVHIVLEDDLKDIYGEVGEKFVEIGKHSSSDFLPISVDIHKLVLRHSAILGSTGSGKSNSTAKIIDNILMGYKGARMVLIDLHGEYSSAFPDNANVFQIQGNGMSLPLYIPYWAMTFDELSFFLVSRQEGSERPEDKMLREEIVRLKRANAKALKDGVIEEYKITADSPIPFDIRKLWYTFNRQVNATYSSKQENAQTKEKEELIEEGDYKLLKPAKFKEYGAGSTPPFKSKNQTMYSYEKKIYSRLQDNRFDFMFNPGPFRDVNDENDLSDIVKSWIGTDKRLSIIDLSGVPFDLVDISVGILTRLIYDSMFWGKNELFTGRGRPLLMIYEEAHKYLPKNETSRHIYGYARKGVERIFKEGRKFGIGAMVVSQRPSELSETILAQVGTFISLRLTNSSDQNTVKSSVPNNMNSLIDMLPALRIGESIVSGEAIKIASRVRFDLHRPRPSSNDPNLVEAWIKKHQDSDGDYKNVITNMRERTIKKR